jgi:hypothetical protein
MKITALRPYGLGLMVLLAAWFCYWRTAGMTLISYSDSAELVAASYTWGIPHAPGYPLYMLLGKVWSFFLGGDVARRYSLLSCIWGSLTVFLVFLSVKRLAGSVAAAVLAAAGLAFAYHFWLYSLVPEISALNGFFGAAIIYWVVRQSGKNLDWKALGSLGLIYGLSMTHHHTLLLWLPALGCYLFVSWPRNQVNRRRLLFLFGCVAIGLLPYIYLPVASHFHPVFNALHDASPAGIFKFITRQNYGSLVLASAYSSLSPEVMTASLGFYFQCLLKSFFWTGLLLGTAGLYHLRRRKEGVFLMLAFFCSGPLLFSI